MAAGCVSSQTLLLQRCRQAAWRGEREGRESSPKPDFPFTQILLMARLGRVPGGGTLGMDAGGRGTQEGKSLALCVPSWTVS